MALEDIVYWDTCIFFAHLKNEEHRNGELAAIKKQVAEFDAGNLIIATSAITLTELMPSKLTDEQIDLFKKMHRRSNFYFVDASPPITELAVKLRDEYAKLQDDGTYTPTVSTPDAIHVASAIALKIPTLLTLDSENKPKKSEIGLTKLNDYTKKNYGLAILRPGETGQQEMYVTNDKQER